MNIIKTNWLIILILILGFFLRVINITGNSLYGDELTLVYDSYSLLKTGQDQLGNPWPLTLPMGAGRPAGYVYGAIPFVALFGLTELGVRALSILSGLGIIILLYYLGRKLLSERVGLLAAFLAAISPWDISLSRGGFEAHFALFLALSGFYLFLEAKDKPILYLLSALSFGLTIHTYPTYKLSLLLFIPLMFWYQGIKSSFKNGRPYLLVGIVTFLILGIIALSQTFIGGSEKRFSSINIFSKTELRHAIEEKINLERTITKLPQSISKYFHNKPVEYSKVYIENYLQNFSLDFLILHGDRNPRHNMATIGQLYFVEGLLILLGIAAFWQREKRLLLFLFSWIVISPLASSIIDLPHALRSAFMLPPLAILSALGLCSLINLKNKIPFLIVSILFLIQFAFFLQKLYFLAPSEYSQFWSYSAKLASGMVLQNKDKFDFIFLSDQIDNIEYAYPVYSKTEPSRVIFANKNKSVINNMIFKKIGNVYIGHLPEGEEENFIGSLKGSVLFIGHPKSKAYLKNYETVSDKAGQEILIIKKSSS